TSVILCPRSNDKLEVGEAPWALLKKSGVRLAIGTDSLASNDSLSLFDEMRFLLDRSSGVFTPAEVLAMATTGGSSALSIPGGALVEGAPADILALEIPETPAPLLAETIIREGSIREIFVGGERLGDLL
ncbi:MAG TPA: amidohydrolase family protein, partial [Verrucomicrobiae bacterium]|nr:amidohydrolase family protein [Verrucomicrobiae bacterium]